MEPKISIIIPVYNGKDTMAETLNSLINQTLKEFEVIIIDDGSIDRTSEIVRGYSKQDSRFKYYYQKNSGVAMARNKGLAESSGRYICFLDSDDYYDNTYLEKMYSRITASNNDVCYCGYKIVSPNSKRIRKSYFRNGNILQHFILGRITISTNGWMIKNELLDINNIKFEKGISWGEDFEFFCEVLASTDKVCYVNEYLTNYRVGVYDNRLSAFSLEKLDKDFESIMRIVKNEDINNDSVIENALIDYRLQALLIYRFLGAINKGIDIRLLRPYYDKYKDNINKVTFNNGLRSIKLNISRIKLNKLLK